jgi:predicted O-methyltransferase YrrM
VPDLALPGDFEAVIDEAWQSARAVPGYLGELEFRALCLLAAAAPGPGLIVEIGSFKGKSTIGLASIAAHYGFSPVVSIDPHNAPAFTDPMLGAQASSFDEFLANLRSAGVEQHVKVHRAPSWDVAAGWNQPIRLLWIDGDHSYAGAKQDFDLFAPHLADRGIVAFHDALHEFEGPIRVFVEDILRSDRFGPAAFMRTIAWGQYRPVDGTRFRAARERLARRAAKLIPFVAGGRQVKGLMKLRFKLRRALVPHSAMSPAEWNAKIASQLR